MSNCAYAFVAADMSEEPNLSDSDSSACSMGKKTTGFLLY